MNDTNKKGKSKKFVQISQAAHDLFMAHGIKRITIEEICRVAEVSKMTFYRYFKNKNEITIHVLDEIFTAAQNRYNDIMAQDVPYSEKVKGILQLKMDASQDVSGEMMKDLWHNPVPEVAAFVQQKTQETLQQFLSDLSEGQKKGDIRPDIKLQFILYIIGIIQNMSDDEKLLNMYDSVQDLVSEIINFFFYGILSRGKN